MAAAERDFAGEDNDLLAGEVREREVDGDLRALVREEDEVGQEHQLAGGVEAGRARQADAFAGADQRAHQDIIAFVDGLLVAHRGLHLRRVEARHREERERLGRDDAQLRDGTAQGDRLLVGLPHREVAARVVIHHHGECIPGVLPRRILRREDDMLGVGRVIARPSVSARPVHPGGHAVLRGAHGQIDGGVQLGDGRTRERVDVVRIEAKGALPLITPEQDRVARLRGLFSLGREDLLMVRELVVEDKLQGKITHGIPAVADGELMRVAGGEHDGRRKQECLQAESSHLPNR